MKLVIPKKRCNDSVVTLTSDFAIPLKSFSNEQIEEIKDSLTFNNPAYASAKRFSPYSRVYVDQLITYYHSSCGYLHIPAGTDLSPLNDPPVEDRRITVYSSTVPKFVLELREDQKAAAESYLKMNNGYKLRAAVQLPTGKGKTVLALYLAAKLKQKTLVIVHKDDLVVGWQNDVDLCFNHKCVPGLIKAKSRKVGSFITIATAQTLSRMDEDELSMYLNSFGFVVLDEMHHCPASMFEFVNRFTSRYRLGLTATAERKDGLAHVMKLYFGDFCYKYKSTGKEKDILPVTVIRRSADFLHIDPVCAKDERGRWFVKDFRTDPNSYRLKKGELFISDVPYNVRPRLVFNDYSDMVVRRMKDMVMSDIAWEYYQGHSCIVFFSLKSQVDDFAEYLHQEKKIPVCDIHKYYGNNSAKENNRVMKEVENRRQGVTLTTYSKTSEGTNVRQWEVAFLVSSINDAKNTEQVVGRVRRVKEGCKLPRAVVYDYRCPFVYSLASHALTRDARYRKLGAQFANSNDQKERKSRGHSARMFTRGYVR